MSTEQKVALVEEIQETFGLNFALAAIGLPKSTWYYHQKHKLAYEEKHADLLPILEEIARKHPEYGLPRIMPELRDVYKIGANHKVVERLLRTRDLQILRSTHRPRPSSVQQAILAVGEYANLVAQLDEIALFQVVYTDFTEIPYANGQKKAFLIPIIGHVSKVAFGWAVGEHADTPLALQAWERAKATFRELDIAYAETVIVHHDRDPVFTGYGWTSQLLLDDKVLLSYALRGAKDNPEMEAFNSRFKSEGQSLFLNAQTFTELVTVVGQRMVYYNTHRRHSAIGQIPPLTFVQRSRSNLSK
jgi:transposase InsO family protein